MYPQEEGIETMTANHMKLLTYNVIIGIHIDMPGANDTITTMRPRTVLNKLAPLLKAPRVGSN